MEHSVMILSDSDIRQLNITFKETFDAIHDVLVEHGKKKVILPPKFGVHPSPGAHCNAMPAYVPKIKALGIKWVSGFPGNVGRGYPYIMGTLIINDDETGAPLAIMEASWLTAMRTAAVAGLAVKHLRKKGANKVGLVGTGVQGRFTIDALFFAVPDIKQISLYDISKTSMEDLARNIASKNNIPVTCCRTPEEALRNSDIMLTATSFVEHPYVKSEWLREGDVAVLIHHRGWENAAFHRADKIIVDDAPQTKAYGTEDGGFYGEIPEFYCELGEVLAGLKPGREKDNEKILAITCGLAIEDMAMGRMIYEKAKQKGVGTNKRFM